jgi:hypothetical protein
VQGAETIFCRHGTRSYHSASYRRPASVPGPDTGIAGISTAATTITVDEHGAKLKLNVMTSAAGEKGEIAVSGTLPNPNNILSANDDQAAENGSAMIAMVENGPGSVRLLALHEVKVSSGKIYQGMLTMVCR